MSWAEHVVEEPSNAVPFKMMPMKVLAVMGQHQYGDPQRGEGTEYAAFIPALKRLGHETFHFESWSAASYLNLAELNSRLVETVIKYQPEVLLFVPFTCEIWLETIRLIGRYGVATVCWTTDDSWKYREQSRFLGHAFHAMTTTYPDKLCDYRRDGIGNVLLTQWAARSEALKPPIPASKCKYQVSFVGAAHGDRQSTVERLRESGIEVECFGKGWPNGPVSTSQIAEIMRDSVISLNFANSKGANQIKARTFEVPGAGGFLLTQNADGLQDWYVPDAELAVYENFSDLVSKIDYFLSHAEARDRIARAGYERTKLQHTYDQRMAAVLEFALESYGGVKEEVLTSEDLRRSICELVGEHRLTAGLRVLRAGMVAGCGAVWGRNRGSRAARRLVHEVAWRCFGERCYTSTGITGRMFPHR